MDKEKLFEDYRRKCVEREEVCGQGNPNANILIIGKEPYGEAIDLTREREKYLKHLRKNYENCRDHCFYRGTDDFSKLVTWQNYQKLIFAIYKGIEYNEYNKNIIDFERFAYTTELSSVPRPKSNYNLAKEMILKRLDFFKNSGFIQSFPVIILACGPYIKNIGDGENRQIDNTFGVTFRAEKFVTPTTEKITSPTFRFYTHYNEDDSKLVIHNRQLSNFHGNGDQLLKEMATVIRKHLKIEYYL